MAQVSVVQHNIDSYNKQAKVLKDAIIKVGGFSGNGETQEMKEVNEFLRTRLNLDLQILSEIHLTILLMAGRLQKQLDCCQVDVDY